MSSSRTLRPGLLPVAAFALVATLQIWARYRVPLAVFGANGAELIPHVQRQYAVYYQGHQGPSMWLHPWHTLRALDGQYPGLLHLLAAAWRWLPGGDSQGGFAMAAHLNLPMLALLAWSAWELAPALMRRAEALEGAVPVGGGLEAGPLVAGETGEGGQAPAAGETGEGGPPVGQADDGRAWASAVAATLVLLIPGLFAAARRYYYDLPMTAAILAAAASLLGGRGLASPARAAGAALATAAALLFKWAAALYLAPIWLLGLWSQRRSPARARALSFGLLALAAVAACCGPVATVPGGSFAFQRQMSSSPLKSGHGLWSGLEFYGTALWSAGLGPGLALAFGCSSLAAWSTAEGRRALGRAAWVSIPPLLYLAGGVAARDGRYLMPLLPWLALAATAGVVALGRRAGRGWAASILLVAVLQVAWVDGATHLTTAELVSPGTTGWRAWWWTGIRRDVPSPAPAYEALARAALRHAPRGRILVASADATSPYIKAWQYYLDALRPGAASLVTPPAASSAVGFVDGVAAEADVVAAVGTLGRPALVGSWIRRVSRQPADEEAVAKRFKAEFPVHLELEAEGLEVHLYARE